MNYESFRQKLAREEFEKDRKRAVYYTVIATAGLIGFALYLQGCNKDYSIKNLNQYETNVRTLERIIR